MDEPPDHPIVIFDGVCNFCDWSVRFLMDRDPDSRFRFASNESDVGASLLREHGVDPSSVDSVYLLDGGRLWKKSAATLEIARRMRWPWKALYAFVIVPRPVRDWLYGVVARNRYRIFGKSEACRVPTEAERGRFLG